jgi:hypothetical protein
MIRNKKILGRKTYIDFIDLGTKKVIAKVDTGAYKNAIHCNDIKLSNKKDGQYLTFKILDPEHPVNQKPVESKEFSTTRVKSSFGKYQVRYVVSFRIKLEGSDKVYKTKFTLADRSRLRNPVLLGRKFLKNRFVIDVSKNGI